MTSRERKEGAVGKGGQVNENINSMQDLLMSAHNAVVEMSKRGEKRSRSQSGDETKKRKQILSRKGLMKVGK